MRVTIAAIGLGLVLFAGCGPLPGPPVNLQIGAATDTTVQLAWTSPVEGAPDSYVVLFRGLGDSAFALAGETTAPSFVHNPHGMTGDYKVAAVFSGQRYEATTVLTTIPVAESSRIVSELDGTGNAGYGWNRTTGAARTCSMRAAADSALVDFYITDFAAGSNRMPYCIASPNMGPSDPAGLVPTATWRATWITDTLANATAPLPAVDSAHYFNYSPIPRTPARFGWYSRPDNCLAMIEVTRVDAAMALVELRSWFQLVRGLHLIAHR